LQTQHEKFLKKPHLYRERGLAACSHCNGSSGRQYRCNGGDIVFQFPVALVELRFVFHALPVLRHPGRCPGLRYCFPSGNRTSRRNPTNQPRATPWEPRRRRKRCLLPDVANPFPRVTLCVTLGWVPVIPLELLFLLCRVSLLCYSYRGGWRGSKRGRPHPMYTVQRLVVNVQ
jgi:hypothetical protein